MQSATKHLYRRSNSFTIKVKMLRCALHDVLLLTYRNPRPRSAVNFSCIPPTFAGTRNPLWNTNN